MTTLNLIKSKFAKLLNAANLLPAPIIPPQIVVASVGRSGLSAIKTTFNILEIKKSLGLPVGDYEDGSPNQNDLLINAIVEQIFKAIQEDARITVAITPGTQIVASGANAGGPVVVYGSSIMFGTGGAIIQ